ncbi:hypothetical protein ACJQWK_10988 [Exserohilum turcicum]
MYSGSTSITMSAPRVVGLGATKCGIRHTVLLQRCIKPGCASRQSYRFNRWVSWSQSLSRYLSHCHNGPNPLTPKLKISTYSRGKRQKREEKRIHTSNPPIPPIPSRAFSPNTPPHSATSNTRTRPLPIHICNSHQTSFPRFRHPSSTSSSHAALSETSIPNCAVSISASSSLKLRSRRLQTGGPPSTSVFHARCCCVRCAATWERGTKRVGSGVWNPNASVLRACRVRRARAMGTVSAGTWRCTCCSMAAWRCSTVDSSVDWNASRSR